MFSVRRIYVPSIREERENSIRKSVHDSEASTPFVAQTDQPLPLPILWPWETYLENARKLVLIVGKLDEGGAPVII